MIKFIAAFRKEILILIRDLPGLGIVFLMPVLLILVVTLAQENALKSQAETSRILVCSPAGSVLGNQVRMDLLASGLFTLDMDSVGREELHAAVRTGAVPLGIVIEWGDTAMTLVIDPTLHHSYKTTLLAASTFILKGAGGKLLMKQLMEGSPQMAAGFSMESMLNAIPPIRQKMAVKERSAIRPTPVQNNIPGFILFAMFFIVIPLSGSILSEKNEGAAFRLQTLPASLGTTLGAKILVYLLICLIQFLLMVLVGFVVLHLAFGFPPLEMGTSLISLVVATVSAALAAVGFGLLVGSFSRTHNQAALFGSVMVVILGILSGTFLPIHVMPRTIQVISSLSPIRWGIDNYLELFIRDGRLTDILPRSLWSLLFFIFAMLISMRTFARRH